MRTSLCKLVELLSSCLNKCSVSPHGLFCLVQSHLHVYCLNLHMPSSVIQTLSVNLPSVPRSSHTRIKWSRKCNDLTELAI